MFRKIIEVARAITRAIKNMFPVEAGTLNDFVALAKENGNLVEIKPVCEIEMSQNINATDSLFFSIAVIGRRYFVQLVSKTKKGQEIIYYRFCGFLPVMSNRSEEKKLFEKTCAQAKIIFNRIRTKWPSIPTKIIQT